MMAEFTTNRITSTSFEMRTGSALLSSYTRLEHRKAGFYSRQALKDERKRMGASTRNHQNVGKSQPYPANAARERSRVQNLRQAFHNLQAALPSVPPDTKLSKLDILILAANYIAHLTQTLDQGNNVVDHVQPLRMQGYLHPVKKWPMRSHLYSGAVGEILTGVYPKQKDIASGEQCGRAAP
ncbi:transcription factor 24-like [Polypterus senegalus]|uniref:transcription factor 24-like n=1 Tax=Polypterus senegalus TaxID=55291 RepID=UPI001963CD62|nr:transcription factor 24-like [Polypterus senegalus]